MEVKNNQLLRILIIGIFLQISCTSNPFWDDNTRVKMTLSGMVMAENKDSMVPIVVWLDGFDKKTTTNEDGYFEFTITTSQSSSGNVNGGVNVYFFLYNYELDSATIFFTNGHYSEDQTDFSTSGELLNSIYLKKLFTSILTHEETNQFSGDTIIFNHQIHTFQKTSIVNYKLQMSKYYSHLLFTSVDDGQTYSYTLSGVDQYGNETMPIPSYLDIEENETLLFDYLFLISDLSLPDGLYAVYPYFYIPNLTLPDGLYAAIGGDSLLEYSSEYLELPIDYIPDTLSISSN